MITYFIHDVNASQDPKIIRLLMQHGSLGYGIFWRIIEAMSQSNDGYLVADFNLLGYQIREKNDVIKSVVCDFGLFEFSPDSKSFTSQRLQKNISAVAEKSEKAREKIAKRWSKAKSGNVEKQENYNSNTTVLPQYNNGKTTELPKYYSGNTNKIREDEIKEDNNISISPSPLTSVGVKSVIPQLPLLTSPVEEKTAKQEQMQLELDFQGFFWNIYPRKRSRKDALKAYIKARKKASRDEILNALREVKAKEWKYKELQYVPYASTWLNQERWNDEVQEKSEQVKKPDPLDDLDLDSNPFD